MDFSRPGPAAGDEFLSHGSLKPITSHVSISDLISVITKLYKTHYKTVLSVVQLSNKMSHFSASPTFFKPLQDEDYPGASHRLLHSTGRV